MKWNWDLIDGKKTQKDERGIGLVVGKWYRMEFPGTYAKVLPNPPRASEMFPYLVESMILRSRWYVNAKGEPDNHSSPHMIVAPPLPPIPEAMNHE